MRSCVPCSVVQLGVTLAALLAQATVGISKECCALPGNPGTDIVIAIDRSNSIGEGSWYGCYLPFIKELVNIVQPKAVGGVDMVRIGFVVFPATKYDTGQNAKQIGDRSGGADEYVCDCSLPPSITFSQL